MHKILPIKSFSGKISVNAYQMDLSFLLSDVFINGLRVKAISGVDSSKLKLRIKNK